nr:hypothetical protein Itr_chr04CG25460 [Ipomoea trifida]
MARAAASPVRVRSFGRLGTETGCQLAVPLEGRSCWMARPAASPDQNSRLQNRRSPAQGNYYREAMQTDVLG